jgi:hypothetical protein
VVTDPGHVLIAPIAEPLMLLEDDASPADALRTAARLAATRACPSSHLFSKCCAEPWESSGPNAASKSNVWCPMSM